jgi:internalin A
MKRLPIALFLVILSAATVRSAPDKDPKPAKTAAPAKKPQAPLFPDKQLEATIREELKKGEKEDLKEDELPNVYFVHGSHKKIKSLTGLEKCVNLASIDLADNELVDLKPLSGLVNVQTLDLSHNQITDVAPLAPLVKLQYLRLDSNQIENLQPLKELKKLTTLDLSKNKVRSLEPVAGLEKLVSLYLEGDQVSDLGPLKGLKWIEELDLRDNQVSNLSALSGMTELRHTMLQGNKVTDLETLVTMAKKDAEGDRRFAPYWFLYLKGNPLTETAVKQQVTALKSYNVRVDLEK